MEFCPSAQWAGWTAHRRTGAFSLCVTGFMVDGTPGYHGYDAVDP
jgi:hypothetical protein